MKIIFIGQRGIPVLNPATTPREARVQALAKQLAAVGHRVVVTCAQPFIATSIKKWHSVHLRHIFSLYPDKPGGVLHLLLGLAFMGKQKPAVVHMHGWLAASFSWLAALVSPLTTFVWTVDTIPRYSPWVVRFIAWQAKHVFDAITVPTRELQYYLLQDVGLAAIYIPDGYSKPATPGISLKTWGLRRNQYVAVMATKSDQGWVRRVYKTFKTRKPLVFIAPTAFPRVAFTLLSHAAVVIVASPVRAHTILSAMAQSRAIISVTTPLHEETLGVSAQFIKPGSAKALEETLRTVISQPAIQQQWGGKAKKRAHHHFGWKKIASEYLALYHSAATRPVSIDSVVPVLLENTAG